MKKLQVSFSELESLSKSINKKNEEFVRLLNEINKLNSDLKLYWEGNDASKYSTAVEIQAKSMKELSDKLAYCSGFLSAVSSSFQQLMKENSEMMK